MLSLDNLTEVLKQMACLVKHPLPNTRHPLYEALYAKPSLFVCNKMLYSDTEAIVSRHLAKLIFVKQYQETLDHKKYDII